MVINNGKTTMNGNNNNSGHMITLNIHLPRDKTPHSMEFDIQMLISDVYYHIQQHLPITVDHECKKEKNRSEFFKRKNLFLASEYGLFINDLQNLSKSYWLDASRTLNYYPLKNGVGI